jgi:hypothetical protein
MPRMLLLFPLWLVLGALCCAIGLGVWRLAACIAPAELGAAPRPAQAFWMGLCALLAELQLFSPFHRLDSRARLLVLLTGALGIRAGRPALRAWWRRARRQPARLLATRAALCALVGFVTGIAATRAIEWYDTISTHIQQAKWASSFRAIRGLGNLNPKLGFDQVHHLLAAVLDFGPYAQRFVHATLGFLVVATLVHWVFVLTTAAETGGQVRQKVFAALSFPYLAVKLTGSEVASLSGDLAMGLVVLVGVLELAGAPWSLRGLGRRRTGLALLTAAMLGGAAFATKFSALVFSIAVLCAFASFVAHRSGATGRRRTLALLVLPGLLVVGTITRRLILTGWPFYPVPVLAFPFEWTVLYARVLDQYVWIKSWARAPGVSPSALETAPAWRWLIPWFDGFRRSAESSLLYFGLIALAARGCTSRDRASTTPLLTMCDAVALLSIAYWFFGAPDLRFGGVFFWLLFAGAWTPILAAVYPSPVGRVLLLVAFTGLLGWSEATRFVFEAAPNWTELSIHPVPETAIEEIAKGTPDAFSVHVPVKGRDSCGDAPLPCTSYQGIQRLRVPGRISRGFVPVESRTR